MAANDDYRGHRIDGRIAAQDVSISQWGSVSELPLETGFGGNFSMSAGYTEFGRQTSFSWKSDARGEAIMGALSSMVDAASAARSALTTDLEGDKAEIDRLQTAKTLNELEYCRQVIEAGGFTCPAPGN